MREAALPDALDHAELVLAQDDLLAVVLVVNGAPPRAAVGLRQQPVHAVPPRASDYLAPVAVVAHVQLVLVPLQRHLADCAHPRISSEAALDQPQTLFASQYDGAQHMLQASTCVPVLPLVLRRVAAGSRRLQGAVIPAYKRQPSLFGVGCQT